MKTISMHAAVFAGGYGTITEKYRLQEQPGGVGDWVNLTGWQSGIPTYNVSQSLPGDKLRFQTQGKDSLGTQKTSNSSITTVGVATEIGTVSIAPPATTGNPGDTITYDVLISGDANPMYIWSIRSGPGAIISPTNIGQEMEVRVNADATPGDSIQVQVTCNDPSASDNGVGAVATIVVKLIMSYIQQVVAVVSPNSNFGKETTALFKDVKAIQAELAEDTPWLIYAGLATGSLYAKEVQVG